MVVCGKKLFTSQLGFAVGVVAVNVLLRIRPVSIDPDVVRNVSDNQLRPWNLIPFKILKMISD